MCAARFVAVLLYHGIIPLPRDTTIVVAAQFHREHIIIIITAAAA